ncbi:MAG: type II secretion system ATPase GspE [Candidatus Endonucleobacter bathymodioli]|uniref:Type II secretion system protein E n=1 Tax=Candidatus Endonucleibacter bathymodioli TaxID=539814 RepID=A0AA90NKF3_9GAMM|nr:type II secretion system ATPase GspE [Candidatus Endonucleobacter bathymodioli]
MPLTSLKENVSEEELSGIMQSDLRLPFPFAKRHGVVVIWDGSDPLLYFCQPPSAEILAEVRRFVGQPTRCKSVSEDSFNEIVLTSYHKDSSEALQDAAGLSGDLDLSSIADAVPITEDLLEQSDDAPVIRLINALLTEAVKEGASDIHIETFENNLIVRIRVDGLLKEVLQLQRMLAALLVSRIKVMARLDIAEKRIPQDGRISLRVAGKEVDVRVSTLPSSNGERVVLRLLDKASGRLDLEHLGMAPEDKERIERLLTKSYGIILVTGPTGSGKTTSLYACLSALNDKCRNILTVEDPIEYNLQGIGQTQVNTKVDMTFARGLRAILRQDPDVVMVGEIRDKETAEIAVQASLTGHLVLSTLHTNTAVGALTRLQDMGIESFLLASSLLGVIAQRLVRVLCDHCKESFEPDEAECAQLSINSATRHIIYRAKGCKECNFNGYKGRTGIYEVLIVDEDIRKMIHSGQGEQAVTTYVRNYNTGIRCDGARKVLDGVTTLEEVLRVTQGD